MRGVAAGQERRAIRVLLVDDDIDFRSSLSNRLRKRGIEVDEASSVEQGLQMFSPRQDVLVSDLQLTDGTGLDLIRGLRQRESQIPAILITCYADVPSVQEALKLKAFEYIEKPLGSIEEILRPVREAARVYREQQEHSPLPGPAEDANPYASIVDSAKDFMILLDPEYHHAAVNLPYARALYRSRDEVVGTGLAEIWGEEVFRTKFKSHIDQCFLGKEVRFRTWLEVFALGREHVDIHLYPRYNDRGEVAHVAVIGRIITNRTEENDAMRKLGIQHLQVDEEDEALARNVLQLVNVMDPSADLARIRRRTLPEEYTRFVEHYDQFGGRDEFIWKWCWEGWEAVTLSDVEPDWREHVLMTKAFMMVLDVIVDDIADRDRNEKLLEVILSGISNPDSVDLEPLGEADRAQFQLTIELWDQILDRVRQLPRYGEFESAIKFDYFQLFNCMRYALLVNEDPAMLNQMEHDLYQPHNMGMIIGITLDLMACPDFDRRELGLVREVAWNAQHMGRIGNAVSTWQREVKDLDYTSDVFPLALGRHTIELSDLGNLTTDMLVERVRSSGLEFSLLATWARRRQRIIELAKDIHSIDVLRYVKGLETLLRLHLISRGFK